VCVARASILVLAKEEKLTANSCKPTWQKWKIDKTHIPARIYVLVDRGCHQRFHVGVSVKKEIKNREGFLM
jgi:hypothetical protein